MTGNNYRKENQNDDMFVETDLPIGYKIKRMREILGMKQAALAIKLGMPQQTLSDWEQSSSLKREDLKLVAVALGVSVEAIEKFEEKTAIQFINCTNNGNGSGYGASPVYNNNTYPPEFMSFIEKMYEEWKEANKKD